ncbi:hypothetical protein AD998_14780 [bacterium 336/3]|nr:hypothetical protein AD998_14780 [bacterium 336/3]
MAFWVSPNIQNKDCCEIYLMERKKNFQYKIINNCSEDIFIPSELSIDADKSINDTIIFEAYLKTKLLEYCGRGFKPFIKIESNKIFIGKYECYPRRKANFTFIFRIFTKDIKSHFWQKYELKLEDISVEIFTYFENCYSYLVRVQKVDKIQ